MEQKVVIRYVSGTKGSAVEEISISGRKELIAGRGPHCDIRYDLDSDDLVSRRHMKIEIGGSGELEFTAVDLGSRNGTFINKRRINQPGKLQPGDIVQLGAGGPEFVFDVHPAASHPVPPAENTTAFDVLSALRYPPATDLNQPVPEPAGKRKTHWWKRVAVAVIVLLALAVLTVFVVRFPHPLQPAQLVRRAAISSEARLTAMTHAIAQGRKRVSRRLRSILGSHANPAPAEGMASAALSAGALNNAESFGTVESGWMLLDEQSGRQIRQIYIGNSQTAGSDAASAPLVPNAGRKLPLFVLLSDNRLQPALTLSDDPSYRPIGATYRSGGFLAGEGGLMLTSRRVAAPWTVPYEWPADAVAGVVARFDKQLKPVSTAVIARRQFPQWLPVDSQFILADSPEPSSPQLSTKDVHPAGRLDYLTVSLNPSRRLPARLVRTADRLDLDLAVIQIEPGGRPVPQLRKNGDCRPGDEARMPNLSDPKSDWRGRVAVLRTTGEAVPGQGISGSDRYEIDSPAAFSVTIGHPVFDSQGQVMAIQAADDPLRSAGLYAIPIRYGIELLNAPKR